jgi:ABC-type multidrug transport system fused ATPase/permease subunit
MKKITETFVSLSKNIWFGIKTSFIASKKYFLLKCLILLSTTFIPLINIWLWKEILNGIAYSEISSDTVIKYLIIYLALIISEQLLLRFDVYISDCYIY